MLEDRDYMRNADAWKGGSMSFTALICFVLMGAYVVQCIGRYYFGSSAIDEFLALTVYGVKHGWIWQLLTFQFLHASVYHLIGNLIGLWCFGRPVEGMLGRRRFAIALFGSGAVGGILQGILMVVFPGHFGASVVGASAGIFGMLAIFALLDPGAVIFFNFVIPIRAIWLLYFFGGLSLFFTLFPQEGGDAAYAAHLGGILAGIAWVKNGWHHDYVKLPWESWFAPRERAPTVSKRRPTLVIDADLEAQAAAREVDRILEKISAKGINSLTASERETLESARKQMNSK
jgi:membrane associated rhomboid family serine protease